MKVAKAVFLFLPLAVSLMAAGRDNALKSVLNGHNPRPRIDAAGRVSILFVNDENRLSLGREGSTAGFYSIVENGAGSGIPVSPVLETDRNGGLWALWAEEKAVVGNLYFGNVPERGLPRRTLISTNSGEIVSSDVDFDVANTAWLSWIRISGGKPEIIIHETGLKRTWKISQPTLVSASKVRILAEGPGKIWVVWSGRNTGRDEIFWSRFDGTAFSQPARLNADNSVPHLFLNAVLSPSGRPWIVWSSYDGGDYEIYISRRTDAGWMPEQKLTDNAASDAFPSLIFADGLPIAVWSRAAGAKTSILARYFESGRWQPEVEIYSVEAGTEISDPEAAARNGRLVVFWQSGGKILSKSLSLLDLKVRNTGVTASSVPQPARQSVPDENTYIGFGDSITYGYIHPAPAPEKGYIPRLETILEEKFGPSVLVNAGSLGEITVNGLSRMDEVLAANAAGTLFLMEGTNDVVFLEISSDATAFNLEQMILKCRTALTFPVISTIIPRNDDRWEKPVYRNRVYAVNTEIRRIARNLNVPMVDMFNTFFNYPESEGGYAAILSDGVHPNELGYVVMTAAWWNEIKVLPFAPKNVKVSKTTERSLLSNRKVNCLTWEHNPKISNLFKYRSYKIRRMDLANEEAGYQLIAVLPYSAFHNPQKYNDLSIEETHSYRYVISLVRLDGVEGPLSDSAGDSD